MTGATLISNFKQLTGFVTDLGNDDILALLNRKYRKLLAGDMWEFLRRESSGTIATDGTIPVPGDFSETMVNWSDDASHIDANVRTILVNGSPYRIVPMASRNSTSGGTFCWFDPSVNAFKFPSNMSGSAYSFDYKYMPTDITSDGTVALPSGLEMIVVYDALIDEDVIEKSEKARSFAEVNTAEYRNLLSSLRRMNLRASFAQ